MNRRRHKQPAPGEGKRKLLQKTLAPQRRKLADAEQRGDAEEVACIERRMQHVHHLIAELEAQ